MIESLTQENLEVKLEIDNYYSTAGTAKILSAVGFGILFTGIIVSEKKGSDTERYVTVEERNKERSNSFLTFSLIGFIPVLLSDVEGKKAVNSLKKVIIYYNKSIENK